MRLISTFAALACLMLSAHSAAADDLTDARDWLDGLAHTGDKVTGFSYDSCVAVDESGSDKFGCQLTDHNTVGLVICKDPSCDSNIQKQLDVLTAIGAANLPVIGFINQDYQLPCRANAAKTCNGYLLQWYSGDRGKFYKPTGSNEAAFIQAVNGSATRAATCTDFKAIYTSWKNGAGIGDFQGVLVAANGHFLIADPTRFAAGIPGTDGVKRVCNAICPKENGLFACR